MSILILKDGKFYRNGIEEPIEIGNREQIDLLKKQELLINQLTNDGVDCDIDEEEIIIYTISIKCICGRKNTIEYEKSSFYDPDLNEFAVDKLIKCRSCKKEYILKEDDCGDLVYKLKNN